jgi:murein DD-endopeptidase MepM/ murein hydrolase activator NlpD
MATEKYYQFTVGHQLLNSSAGTPLNLSNEKLLWLVNHHNHPLKRGDTLHVIEVENEEGHHYPLAIKVDYRDDRYQDLELYAGVKEDLRFAFRVDYYDRDYRLRRQYWQNFETMDLFDVQLYELETPLGNRGELFQDFGHEVTLGFGNTTDVHDGAFGGNGWYNHQGLDYGVDPGTDIFASYDGTLSTGYAMRPYGHNGINSFLSYGRFAKVTFTYSTREISDRRDQTGQRLRYKSTSTIEIIYAHLSEINENLREQFIDIKVPEINFASQAKEQEYRDWLDSIMSYRRWFSQIMPVHIAAGNSLFPDHPKRVGYFRGNEEKIVDNFDFHYVAKKHGVYFSLDGVKVKKGDLLGTTGNTGNTTGPHLHFEVKLNGESVDPQAFFRSHGITQKINATIVNPIKLKLMRAMN